MYLNSKVAKILLWLIACLIAVRADHEAMAKQGIFAAPVDQNQASLPSFRQILMSASDERLVETAHRSDWNAWVGRPGDVHDELLARASSDPNRALRLSSVYMRSFLTHGAILGSVSAGLFQQIVDEALKAVMELVDRELVVLTVLFGQFSRATALHSDRNKAKQIETARLHFAKRVLREPIDNFSLSSGAGGYERAWKTFRFLRALNASRDPSARWLLSESAEISADERLAIGLIGFARAPDFPILREMYENYAYAVPLPRLLRKMHLLRPEETLKFVQDKILNFDEASGFIEGILEEIAFLKEFGNREMIAALMPRILRLLEIAENRGENRSAQAIVDSLMGMSGARAGEGVGAGALRWSDIVGSGGSITDRDAACASHARTALVLYQRGLIGSEEMRLALQDLAGRRCDDQNSRGALLGVVVTICDLAVRAGDSAAIEVCKQNVLYPLGRYALSNEANAHAHETAMAFLDRLIRVLGETALADLPKACRVSVSRMAIFNDREQLLVEGEHLVFARGSSGRLEKKDCRTGAGELSVNGVPLTRQFIGQNLGPLYQRVGEELVYQWKNLGQEEAGCGADIFDDDDFRQQIKFVNLPASLLTEQQIAAYTQFGGGMDESLVPSRPFYRGNYQPWVPLPSIQIERLLIIPGADQSSRSQACHGPT